MKGVPAPRSQLLRLEGEWLGQEGHSAGLSPWARRRDAGLGLPFFDKHTYPLKQIPAGQNLRIVPGGSSIRDGCYIGKNVTCMPPMYVNVGAYVDDGALIDSHALVGLRQVGKRVHLSAAAQIGGVLEPSAPCR